MELQEAERWLEGLINVERMPDFGKARLGLGAIRALLEQVGNPQQGLCAFHIAGSKGKGSTALLAEAVLRELGVRTGTFTSPHLVRWTERFRIDGREVEDADLAEVLTRLRPHVDALREGADAPSFFDATTAAAFLLFAGVDVAILEVGLGGRLDSTNACQPRVTAITSIELEHTERLGETHAAIAGEKAGIAKPGVPLVIGALSPEAEHAVASRAAEVGAPLVRLGADYSVECLSSDGGGTRFRWSDGSIASELELAAPGEHQAANAGIALACIRRLELASDDALVDAARRAYARCRLPGRIELLGREPWLVVDAAHTAASARALAEILATLPHDRGHLVLSVSAGKDLAAICKALAPFADEVTITRAEPVRSLQPGAVIEVLNQVAPDARLRVELDPERAVQLTASEAGPSDLVCATGSFYLAGIARRVLGAR